MPLEHTRGYRYPMLANPPVGLPIMQLACAPLDQAKQLVDLIGHQAEIEFADKEDGAAAIEFMEELLIRRFAELSSEELQKMFHLEDLRNTRFWQEAHQEDREEGITLTMEKLVHTWSAEGKSVKEIAALLRITQREVRRLAKLTQ